MSNPGDEDATPITSVRQLAAWIAEGCKPPERFAIGTEHEKFGFRRSDLAPPPYEPGGIRAVLEGLQAKGWTPLFDGAALIALKRDGAAISLEPAGQFELSGAPLADLHQTRAEFDAHFAELREVADPLGLGFAPLGFHPLARRGDMPWMPKARYGIMRRYMPTRGSLGLDMMTRTCTVQVNLDYASEADMVRKLRVGLCLQPLATALFANSPFVEGKPNGFLSNRAQVWTDTDPDRSGIPPVMFEDGFGFERYADWVLDVPMYFVSRGGRLVDMAGQSFRRFMAGELGHLVEGPATLGDFADHLSTVFTDVRLKRFLEMRGADAGSPEMMVAQSALWVGLLYDPAALDEAAALVARHQWTEFAALRPLVPRLALDTPWQGGTLRSLAAEVAAIATRGLRGRGRAASKNCDETVHLAPLQSLAEGARTQAETWLERYNGAWRGNTALILGESAI